MPADTYKNLTKRYGHWGAELTNCIMDGLIAENLVDIAINCVGKANEKLYIQNMEGLDSLHLNEVGEKWIQEMNPAAENIYRLLGVVSQAELAGLKSVEIPAEIFLQALHDYINICLKSYEPESVYGPGGKYYYPDNEEYYRLHCEKLRNNLVNLDIILSKIKDVKRSEVASPQNEFRFFKPRSDPEGEQGNPRIIPLPIGQR